MFERVIELSRKNNISNLSHMMSMAKPIANDVETLRKDSGCSLEKEFTELIRMNP